MTTALSWIVLSIVGAVPFVLSGAIPNPIDAFFEIVSGFTTTGSSILSDPSQMPYSINIWRCFSHWIGGMGVLVFIPVSYTHLQNKGIIFDRETIYEKVWGLDGSGDNSVITEHIRRIRTKFLSIGDNPYIETVWGCGYKWKK